MEGGVAEEAPRAVWLGRVAAVMEARGDRDEAIRLYGEASAELIGEGRGSGTGTLGHPAGANGNRCSVQIGCGGKRGSVTATGGEGEKGSGGGGGGMRDLFPYSARAHHLASVIERSYRRHFLR